MRGQGLYNAQGSPLKKQAETVPRNSQIFVTFETGGMILAMRRHLQNTGIMQAKIADLRVRPDHIDLPCVGACGFRGLRFRNSCRTYS